MTCTLLVSCVCVEDVSIGQSSMSVHRSELWVWVGSQGRVYNVIMSLSNYPPLSYNTTPPHPSHICYTTQTGVKH